jgi:hypothetical protein
VPIEHTLVRITGVGLIRKTTESAAGERTLRLPSFALTMLRRRELASGGRGPVFPDSVGGWRDRPTRAGTSGTPAAPPSSRG